MNTNVLKNQLEIGYEQIRATVTNFLNSVKDEVFIHPDIKTISWGNYGTVQAVYIDVNGQDSSSRANHPKTREEEKLKFPLFQTELDQEYEKTVAFNKVAGQASRNLAAILREIEVLENPSPLLISWPYRAKIEWRMDGTFIVTPNEDYCDG